MLFCPLPTKPNQSLKSYSDISKIFRNISINNCGLGPSGFGSDPPMNGNLFLTERERCIGPSECIKIEMVQIKGFES